MDYNGTYEPSCKFSAIYRILLDAHAVQYGINFYVSILIKNSKSVPKFSNFDSTTHP
jgi:hypothetical protein